MDWRCAIMAMLRFANIQPLLDLRNLLFAFRNTASLNRTELFMATTC